jgi:hypothetical protein
MSSKYFKNTQLIRYRFGDNENPVLFQKLSTYVDLLDQVRTETSFYQDYTILSGERPDTLSLRLYGKDDFYWTFYMMNDKLRESGWPIANELVLDKLKVKYPHRVVTTKDDFTTDSTLEPAFKVGQVVYGSVSGTVGTIVKRNPSLGQLVIDTTNTVIQEQRSISIEPDENGYVSYQLTDDRESFHSPSLWQVYQDGNIITEFVEIVLTSGKANKKFEISNIPYSESSTYTVTTEINIGNPLDNNFGVGESIYFVNPVTGLNVSLVVHKESAQYDAIHHYERTTYTAYNLDTNTNILVAYTKAEANAAIANYDNAEVRTTKEWVDIDPYTQIVPTGAAGVTVRERFENYNNELKQIKVLKKSVVERVAKQFYSKMRS